MYFKTLLHNPTLVLASESREASECTTCLNEWKLCILLKRCRNLIWFFL